MRKGEGAQVGLRWLVGAAVAVKDMGRAAAARRCKASGIGYYRSLYK